jgi:hypothetical protein
MESDGRKHPIHLPAKDWFNASTIIFVTVCTKKRKPLLATDEAHQLLRQAWSFKASWLVGRYVIMPDQGDPPLVPARGPPPGLPTRGLEGVPCTGGWGKMS